MYQVLLLEDEVEVLTAKLEVVSWEKAGFDTPRGAQNGQEGIAILKDGFVPDVIITDIYMPFVDGLAVAAYAKEHLPETIVVILTGHDDFQYAQKAVQLGVHDYILKPVTPRKIQELLDALYKTLQEREEQEKDIAQVMKGHFLGQLVSRKMDLSTIQAEMRDHKIHFPFPYNTVVVSDLDLPYPETIEERNHLDLMRFGLLNITKELAEDQEGMHVFRGSGGVVTLLIGGRDKETCHNTAKRFCSTVLSIYRQSLQESASYGIGRGVEDVSLLYRSHREAQKALEERFHTGRGSITLYEELQKEERSIDIYLYEQALEKAVYSFDQAAAATAIHSFVKELADSKVSFGKGISETQKLLSHLMQMVYSIAHKTDTSALDTYWRSMNLNAVLSLKELESLLQELLEKAFLPLRKMGRNQTTVQMSQAEHYIRENYANPDLSLREITDHLAVSVSYFSTNFKAHTDMTFVEYLTKVRMEEAKRLMSLTSRRTYEVAAEVGYANPHYFSSSFKRYTGFSPKEYRESYQEDGVG